jgi:hypothetical protein
MMKQQNFVATHETKASVAGKGVLSYRASTLLHSLRVWCDGDGHI